MPIVKKDTDRTQVDEAVGKLTAALKGAGIRTKVGSAYTAEAVHMSTEAAGACAYACAPVVACTPLRVFLVCAACICTPFAHVTLDSFTWDSVQPGRGPCSTMHSGVTGYTQLQMASSLHVCMPPALQVDSNDLKTPGWRYNYWELKGVPVRVEVGPRDVQSGTCVMARRDIPGGSSSGCWGATG